MAATALQPGAGGSPSHCSEATAEIARARGVDVSPLSPKEGEFYKANEQAQNLAKIADKPGSAWHAVKDLKTAQDLANSGRVVVIAWENSGGSGHTVTVAPDPNNKEPGRNPTVAQVGGKSTGNGLMGFRSAFGKDKRAKVKIYVAD
jgi:hypothetical protein